MSCWTYAGVEFVIDGKQSVTDIENLVGHIMSFEDKCNTEIIPCNDRDDGFFYLPRGSEGTLDIYVKKTTENRTEFWVGGGMRDVWSTKETEKWFNSLIENNGKRRKLGGMHHPLILSAKGYCRTDEMGDYVRFNYKYKFSKEEIMNRLKCKLYIISLDIEDFFRGLLKSR